VTKVLRTERSDAIFLGGAPGIANGANSDEEQGRRLLNTLSFGHQEVGKQLSILHDFVEEAVEGWLRSSAAGELAAATNTLASLLEHGSRCL